MPHAFSQLKQNRPSRGFRRGILFTLGTGACLLAASVLFGQGTPKVPTVNANVGGCTADFLVRNGQHKPLYNAKVSVNFRYGFLGMHKMSLEAFTNSQGKARFDGLPDAPKNPLAFRIECGNQHESVADNPGNVCNASFRVTFP